MYRQPQPAWLACAFAALALTACSSAPGPRSEQPPSKNPAAAAATEGELRIGPDGRRYRIERLPVPPGGVVELGNGMVRYSPLAIYELERLDGEWVYVRQYEPVPVAPIVRELPPPAALAPRQGQPRAWINRSSGLPASGQWRDQLALADIDGDGRLDIASGPPRKGAGKAHVFRSTATGWATMDALRFEGGPLEYGGVAVTDFDRDGHLDLAFGMHLVGLAARFGDGRGTFRARDAGLPQRAGGQPAGLSAHRVAAFDWDADGKPELLAVDEVLRRDAGQQRPGIAAYSLVSGTWRMLAPTPAQMAARILAVARDGGTAVLVPEVTGTDGMAITLRRAGKDRVVTVTGLADETRITAAAIDIDPRGNPVELALATLRHHAGGWWTTIERIDLGTSPPRRERLLAQASAADIRRLAYARFGDDSRALLALRARGALDVYVQASDREWEQVQAPASPTGRVGCDGSELLAADLDGDGSDEIVAAWAGEPSVFDVEAPCTSGGAIEVHALARPAAG